ncbi:MAG: DUF4390 domain-containing protein [Acidobacteriaceae bacterium]|nr:DUF4390 domain-containing protein [Acidobacteriaceae bacterium]
MTRRSALGRVIRWSVLLLAVAAPVLHAEPLRIVPITSGDRVVVSFELANAYTDEVREAIASGLRTTFTYEVDLRMIVPTWVDRTIASSVVSISDQYDNLTRRHNLSRSVDGRVESIVTEDEATVRQWLTSVTRLQIVGTSKLEPNRDYYVRVSAAARPRSGSLIGWANAVTGQARFTFIP